MTKRKIGWIAAIAVVLAVSFTLGITGAISLAGPDGLEHIGKITFRADLLGEDDLYITLSDVSYDADEAGKYTATISGELLRRDENGWSVIRVPKQEVSFHHLSGEMWFCVLMIEDEADVLLAYRPRISSVGDETAYGDITYLSYGQVEYLRYDEEKIEDEEAPDRLAGMFITFKPLWDCIGEGALTGDDGTLAYAELKTIGRYNEDGEYIEDEEYVFPGVEGLRLFMCKIQSEDEPKFKCLSPVMDEPLTDLHINVTVGDESKTGMEGTLYFMSETDVIMYINSVYQKEDGRVYVTGGGGFSLSHAGGGHCELSTNDEQKINGETVESSSCEVKLNYIAARIPERCVIFEMDAESVCLVSHVLGGNECPETIELQEKTEYVIVEKDFKNEDGTTEVTREIVGRDAGGFTLIVPANELLCRKSEVNFK